MYDGGGFNMCLIDGGYGTILKLIENIRLNMCRAPVEMNDTFLKGDKINESYKYK
jgi:hypothetical protein